MKVQKNAKCIWICYEIVLRNVLQKSLKDIYMKHYSISWGREMMENGICFIGRLI